MNNRVQCENCNWIGTQEECGKHYESVPFTTGDVTPVLVCPICGNENLITLDDELVPV